MKVMKTWLSTLAVASVCVVGTAHAQISNDVVRIGILNDQSGPAADITGAGSAVAARLAVEDFGPTVRGARIEIVVGDHQNKADVGATIARRWYDVDGVDMIADIGNSAVSLAVQAIAREKSRIVMHVGSATERLIGPDCSPTGFLWAYDTYAISQAVGRANVARGGDSWYFVTADYAFGTSMEEQLGVIVKAAGGQVLGASRHPLYANDFSAHLLKAQGSGAKIVAFNNAGPDTMNAIKQAAEFGLVKGGQRLTTTVFYITNVHGLGLGAAQGLRVATSFYWDRTPETRAFAERFRRQLGDRPPTQVHAGVYSATLAYLRAIEAGGTDAGAAVSERIKASPVSDLFAEGARVRKDGRLMKDMFLAEVKAPAASKGPWDYYEIQSRVPALEIVRPLEAGGCKFATE